MTAIDEKVDAERVADRHIAALEASIEALRAESGRLAAWGGTLADRLLDGGRLLAAGTVRAGDPIAVETEGFQTWESHAGYAPGGD